MTIFGSFVKGDQNPDSERELLADRELQILAETTQRLSDEIKDSEPKILWQDIAGLRNLLVHQYTNINIPRIWLIIENDLPKLSTFVKKNLKEYNFGQ